jgi:hypothetical protein
MGRYPEWVKKIREKEKKKERFPWRLKDRKKVHTIFTTQQQNGTKRKKAEKDLRVYWEDNA